MYTITPKRQIYHKLIALMTASFFFLNVFTADVLALAPQSSAQNPYTRCEFQIACLIRSGQLAFAEKPEDIRFLEERNHAKALLLSHGTILASKDLKNKPEELLRAIIHEQIEAIMQIMAKEERSKYSTLINMVLGAKARLPDKHLTIEERRNGKNRIDLRDAFVRLFPEESISRITNEILNDELLANHVIAKAFELIIGRNDNLLADALNDEEVLFLSYIEPIINTNKHNYFAGVFWEDSVREQKIRIAMANGMRFTQVASGSKDKSQEDMSSDFAMAGDEKPDLRPKPIDPSQTPDPSTSSLPKNNKTNLKPALEIISDSAMINEAASPAGREVVVEAEVNVSSSSDTPNIKREPAVKDLSDEIESKLGIDTHGKLTEFIGRMLGVIPTIHDFDSFVLSQRDPLNTLIQQYGVHLDNEEVEQILIRLLRRSFNLGFIDIDQLGWFNELNLDHPTIVITTRAQGGLGDITKIDLIIRGMKREFEKLKVSKAKFRVLIFDDDREKMAILKNREYPDVDFIFLPSSDPIPENSSYLRDADVFISLDRAVTEEVNFDSKDEGHLPSALVYTTLGQYDRPAPRNPRYKRVKISEIPTGFQHDSVGFLISPFTEELYQRRLGLTEDQKLAEKEHLLAQVIHEILPTQEVSQDQLAQAARSNWGLVYMHEQGMDYLNGIAEYHRTHEPNQSVTLFTLLGETNVWYKGTKEWEGLVSKIRAAGLPVETYDLSHDPKAIKDIDFKKPVVRVINVGMRTLELYVHFMAASDLPVGVTGNESLFTALLLRKRFVYEVATWERTLFLNMLSDMRKVLGERSIAASSVEGIRSGDISARNAVKFWRGDPGLIEEFKRFGDSMPDRALYPKVVRKILRSSAFIRFLDKRDKRTDRAMDSKPHVQAVVRHAGLEVNGLDEYFPSFDLFRKASDHESGIIARVKELLNTHFSPQELKQNGEFLDVGASDGVITEALMAYFKHGVAVEIDENASERLKSKEILGLDVVTAPIQEYTPNHKFDVILVSHSLYYIEEKDRINQIKRMASWLKPGGKLILLHAAHGDSQKDLSRMKKALGVPSQPIDGRAIKDSLISEGFEASLEILESAVIADLDGMLKIAPFVLKKSSLQATTIKSQIQEYIERNLWDETQRNYRLNIPQELLIISNGSGGHNKNALDGPQSEQAMMGDKEHVALYSFGSRDAIMSDQNVPLRYSAYKYGGQEQLDYFLGMLQAEILKKFGDQINSNPGQWVLATTGYSMSKPSIVPLARKLSAKLGIEYVSVRAVRKNRKSGKPLIYADLKTSEAREAVQEMYEYCLESDQSYEGKNVIFIDDFFASGSALKKINTILVNKYQMRIAGNFVIISIASMGTRDPAVEDEINSFLIRSKPLEEIAKLLNRKDTTITRYTVTSLFQMEMPEFRALVALLNDFFLSKLFIAAIQNHRDAVDVEKIKIINDRIRASSLNRETLISHLKQQNGGLVLLGGPSGAGKATEADSLKESLGSPVLPVDFYPSDQGATKYGTKSHELFISHNNDLVWADISQLLQGKGVSVTSPYYYEHQFTRIINPPLNKPLIVDGLHAVNPDFIEGLPKSVPITKVFVDAPKQIRFLRRLLTVSGETNYAAALMMWRNVIEAEEESIDLSRNNADFILVETEDTAEIQRLVKDTATIRASLRDYLAGLDERDDSRIVLKGILDDVESFIEERGIYYNLNKSLQDQADSIRSKRKGLKVGILGGSKPSQEYLVADGEELGRSLANYLRPIHGVAFTGGDSGVGVDFYRGYCSLETSKDEFFALLPIGSRPKEEYERMSSNNLSIERLGTRFSVRNIGMALVGDVFIAMNGGSGTMQEVTEVLKRGKPVVALNYGGVGTILYQAKISGKIPQVLQDNGINENALKFIIPGDISNISQALEHARELASNDAQIMHKGGSELTQDKAVLISTNVTALPNRSSSLLSNIESLANQTAADMERDAKPEDQLLISEINDRIQEELQKLKLRADKGSFIVGNFEDLLHGREKLMEGLRKAPPVIVEFPGTFDPPHLVHVQRMLEALVGVSDTAEPRTYYAVFSPIGGGFKGDGDSGAWKPNKSPFEHRYQMTRLISEIFSPLLSAIDVSRDSTQNKGVIDMLTPVLASDIKPLTNFYTITGADNLEHLETYIAKDLKAVPKGIRKHFAMLDDSDHPDEIARLSSTYPNNVVVVNTHTNLNGARSMEIRDKKRFGILPISIQKYIQEKSLYSAVAQEMKAPNMTNLSVPKKQEIPIEGAEVKDTEKKGSLADNSMNAAEEHNVLARDAAEPQVARDLSLVASEAPATRDYQPATKIRSDTVSEFEITLPRDALQEWRDFIDSLKALGRTASEEPIKRALELDKRCAEYKKDGQSLILYADDILENVTVYDLQYTIKNILAKHNTLAGGKIILFARKAVNAKILEDMIRWAAPAINTVTITEDQTQSNGDEVREVEAVTRLARAKGAKDILAIIRGPAEDNNNIKPFEAFARGSKIPLVIVGPDKALYSLAQALSMAMDAKLSDGAMNGWLIMLPSIRTFTEDIRELHEQYKRTLESLRAA